VGQLQKRRRKKHKTGRKMKTKKLRIRQKEEMRKNAEITAYHMPTYKHTVSCKKICSILMF